MPPSRRSNPDALPSHPMPVRPGLMDQPHNSSPQSSKPPAKPPPVRQYNNDLSPGAQNGAPQTSAMPPLQKRASAPHPVTFDELNRLRNTFKLAEKDHKTGLLLAKKLVEAAAVLSDEGGRADTRTRNKNREKFVMEAHKIVKKLVNAGYPEAMFYLADCYGQGSLGLEVDPKEAFTLYQSAAKAGHAASAYRTAVCCEMGNEDGGGTRKDPLKAVQWYKRAAALGDTAAMYKVGMILLKGLLGQQKNLGEAINMLKRAAERADEDNPHALHELGLLYEAQTGNERIIRDEPYALSLFRQSAELGYKFSQFRIAQSYEFGLLGCPVDHRMSIAWYSRAAAQEEHQSELALSGWYLTGSPGILEQSDTEAYLWARKAACAEPPLGKALFAMGYYTEVGIGCPRSLEEAKRWYGRAAAYKFPKAQERLDELKRGGAKAQRSRERLSRSNQKQHEADNCVVM
ncbi:HCP-like protein [Mytilinidion resinicola]|uniref:HCP-like protein n=1 Tax=Mytilinidion resinicola TaxID=574789 RepID=A0A6A6YMB2_9PEZI|nr:HCP-like protein [Mytilinidion resinicola]KAF2810016.1 HCP-like protein [Mytilinidion resinicola]